jgi:hypothetical protein
MVKGKMYKLANLDKNKRNHLLVSYARGIKDGIGWLWTANYAYGHLSTFQNGDAFVCLGKKKQIPRSEGTANNYGIDTWYEALGPDGKIHRITPSMRTSYFRNL